MLILFFDPIFPLDLIFPLDWKALNNPSYIFQSFPQLYSLKN